MNIKFEGSRSTKSHEEDAAFDLRSAVDIEIPVGSWVAVPTGTKMAIPAGWVGKVCPRSGLAAKNGLTVLNAPGIIDSGYEGEVKVVLVNHGVEPFSISRGDRIAQLLVEPVFTITFSEGSVRRGSARGEGGFGSTGVA